MSDHYAADGSFINSIVGEGTMFRGDLNLNGLLRIDGDFSGSITTSGKVLVGKNGRAECTITAGTVVVGGIIRGNIVSSEKVIVLSTGMVIGNVSTPRLVVEEGVILNGSCTITKDVPGEADERSASDEKVVTSNEHQGLHAAMTGHGDVSIEQDSGTPDRDRELPTWNQ